MNVVGFEVYVGGVIVVSVTVGRRNHATSAAVLSTKPPEFPDRPKNGVSELRVVNKRTSSVSAAKLDVPTDAERSLSGPSMISK